MEWFPSPTLGRLTETLTDPAERRRAGLAVVACVALMVPTIGSFYPLPPYPIRIFPYTFLGWMILGAGWLFVVSRRQPGILPAIEADLEREPEPEQMVIDIHDSVAEAELAVGAQPAG